VLLRTGSAILIGTVTLLAAANAATGLYMFARHHEANAATATTFTAILLGLHAIITMQGWHAGLSQRRMPGIIWALLWTVAVCGIAATASAGDTWAGRAVACAPIAFLAAVTVLVTRPGRP
jgi:hypothetical protein